eukprot:TRINITY_DN1796_c0_g1_i1.p1 TRINITY_DN1796_c0_g1~~TRINITY_DN1796_c0_g1_i1.p1  ORF type:complete len:275 (+),score=45.49 TRINITY_DN1796_c0_g1_i1:23-826(+)
MNRTEEDEESLEGEIDTDYEWLSWGVTMLLWSYCLAEGITVSVILGIWWIVPGMVLGRWGLGGWVESYMRICALWYLDQGDVSGVMLVGGIDWRVWEQALLGGLGLGCLAMSEGYRSAAGVAVVLSCAGFKSSHLAQLVFSPCVSRLLCTLVTAATIYADTGLTPPPQNPLYLLLIFSSILLPPTAVTPTPLPEPFFGYLLTWFFTDTLPTPYSAIGTVEIAAAAGLNIWKATRPRDSKSQFSGDDDEDEEEELLHNQRGRYLGVGA